MRDYAFTIRCTGSRGFSGLGAVRRRGTIVCSMLRRHFVLSRNWSFQYPELEREVSTSSVVPFECVPKLHQALLLFHSTLSSGRCCGWRFYRDILYKEPYASMLSVAATPDASTWLPTLELFLTCFSSGIHRCFHFKASAQIYLFYSLSRAQLSQQQGRRPVCLLLSEPRQNSNDLNTTGTEKGQKEFP